MTENSRDGLPALQVHGLQKSFPSPGSEETVTILSDVSMTVHSGTFIAIVGPSGSGKSTLLHCAGGLEDTDAGEVVIAGSEISKLSYERRAVLRRAHIGFVFQEHNLVDSLTARDNVRLPSLLRRQPMGRTKADENLDEVGLSHRKSHRPHQLSGGEQQRTAIARVMANHTEIVFADEPTGSLDLSASAKVLHWLRRTASEGAAVVMVTHDVHAAARADHVYVMESGRFRFDLPGGSPERISECLLQITERPRC